MTSREDSGDTVVPKLQYVCRYGSMRHLGVMTSNHVYRYGDEVVIRSERGTEIATVLCEATDMATDALANNQSPKSLVRSDAKHNRTQDRNTPVEVDEPTHGRILRRLDRTDRADWDQLSDRTCRDLQICGRHVEALKLKMQLVDAERLLGGERLVVYFIANGRVDFRELVKQLGREFQCRIEMRQIGIRDEAKLLADYGDCGQEVCCSRFLSKMPPVSMKMAKLQRASLDPAKISGRCGRLKCCLCYEFEAYQAKADELPPIGSTVLTRDGDVTVVAQDILAGQLIVTTTDHRRIMISEHDVIQRSRPGFESPSAPTEVT
ncbi:MAG: regulatory iron-sulfur-containing complex subunit RicT [Planctomycetota bacterium]